jgi:hypothetical protein
MAEHHAWFSDSEPRWKMDAVDLFQSIKHFSLYETIVSIFYSIYTLLNESEMEKTCENDIINCFLAWYFLLCNVISSFFLHPSFISVREWVTDVWYVSRAKQMFVETIIVQFQNPINNVLFSGALCQYFSKAKLFFSSLKFIVSCIL